MRKKLLITALAMTALLTPSWARGETPDRPEAAKQAILKALPLIEKSATEYRFQRSCFSCHHQTLPLMAVSEVKNRGFQIDEKDFAAQVERTAEQIRRNKRRFLSGRGPGGRVDSAGYSLWALAVGGHEPDDSTDAVVEYLLKTDDDRPFWGGTRSRPPTMSSDITRTAVAIRVLDAFGNKDQKKHIAERKKKARAWLLRIKPEHTEDKVFQLRALAHLGENDVMLALYAADLIMDQRKDGGWAQKSSMESDPYATATALVALNQAGVEVTDTVYQRGIDYLLKNQQKDGSWHVKTRSRPIQRYFESGFPHGRDQFISIAATCWSTAALARTLPKIDSKKKANK